MNVLAIGCHPDDLEIACGGTLAKYARNGDKVFMCHIANGSMGHKVIEPEDLKEIRRREAQKAASILGAESLTMDVDDFVVDNFDENAQDSLIDIIRYAKPDIIITHNTQDYMRDHMQTSEFAFSASFSATAPHRRTRLPYFDSIAPMFYMDTLAGIGFEPTEYVDISGTIDLKLEALSCHESQIRWMKEHDHIDFLDFVETCSKFRGFQCGAAYAEGFRPSHNWPRMVPYRLLP